MAKYHGIIAYAIPQEITAGVWKDVITEREYYGDVIRESRNWSSTDKVNDNLILNNRLSIVADDFAYLNLSTMRYAKFGEVRWKVLSVEVQRPRLIITLGGVYNG